MSDHLYWFETDDPPPAGGWQKCESARGLIWDITHIPREATRLYFETDGNVTGFVVAHSEIEAAELDETHYEVGVHPSLCGTVRVFSTEERRAAAQILAWFLCAFQIVAESARAERGRRGVAI